jgi:hypothetical protein
MMTPNVANGTVSNGAGPDAVQHFVLTITKHK